MLCGFSLHGIQIHERKKDIPLKLIFINGMLAGIILWMKYSMLGFYFALMAVICIKSLIEKKFVFSIKNAAVFLLGMGVISLPCILYFVINHSTKELIDYYFMNNISGYGEKIQLSALLNSYEWTFFKHLKDNPVLCVSIFVSFIYVIFSKNSASFKILYCLCFIIQFCTTFLHGAMMSYYFFALSSFAALGAICVSALLQTVVRKINCKLHVGKLCAVLCSLVIAVSAIFVAVNNRPRPARFLESSDGLAQIKFAEYMNSKYDKPTLLDFNELDGGFYTAADITPSTWAYCALNWDNPQMDADILNTIKNKKVDFVVARANGDVDFDSQDWPTELVDNYSVVGQVSQYRVSDLYTYFLLEKK